VCWLAGKAGPHAVVAVDVPIYLEWWQTDLGAERSCWRFSRACTMSPRVGRSPTGLHCGATRLHGCHSTSAWRCGAVWRFPVLCWWRIDRHKPAWSTHLAARLRTV